MVAQLTKEKEDEIKHKDFCVDEFNTNELQTEKKERSNATWNWSAPRANWSSPSSLAQGSAAAAEAAEGAVLMAGAAAQHGPKAYRPVKDAAWAAAHPKRTDEAEAWAQTHPKLAEVASRKQDEAEAWLHAHPKRSLSDRLPAKAAEAAAHLAEAQAWSKAQPREAKAWLEAHPKRSLVQHLETLEAEAAEAIEREAMEEQAGKPPARAQGPGGLGWVDAPNATQGTLTERVAGAASILDSMHALHPQSGAAPGAVAAAVAAAAVVTAAPAAASQQEQPSAAGGVGGV